MPTELGPDDKRMRLRYAGTCRLCAAPLSAGTDAVYERATKSVRCIECAIEPSTPDAGTAGASARREYERRKGNREERIRANHPKFGGLILALSDDPQSTRAWERGAVGEELMAQRLADLPSKTFRVLHDRRIPRSRANIDHIVIAAAGVWVIDAKRYAQKRPRSGSKAASSGRGSSRCGSAEETARSSCKASNPRSTGSPLLWTMRRSPSPASSASSNPIGR